MKHWDEVSCKPIWEGVDKYVMYGTSMKDKDYIYFCPWKGTKLEKKELEHVYKLFHI